MSIFELRALSRSKGGWKAEETDADESTNGGKYERYINEATA